MEDYYGNNTEARRWPKEAKAGIQCREEPERTDVLSVRSNRCAGRSEEENGKYTEVKHECD